MLIDIKKSFNTKSNFRKIKYLAIIFIVFIFLFHLSSNVYAAGRIGIINSGLPEKTYGQFADAEPIGILEIVYFLIRLLIVIVFFVAGMLLSLVFGTTHEMSVSNILLNKIDIFNVDFTSTETGKSILSPVTQWFNIWMKIALLIQLVLFIYVLAREIINRVLILRPQKTRGYMEPLKDFFVGIGMSFGIIVFSIGVIKLNAVFIELFEKLLKANSQSGVENQILKEALIGSSASATVSLIIYIIMKTLTILIILYYLKRYIKILFLITIAPLVASTYALDKRAGASPKIYTWAKMFVSTVLIQIIHALIYFSMVSVTFDSLKSIDKLDLKALVFSIAGIKFFWDGEVLITSLFDIKVEPAQQSALASYLVLQSLMNKAGQINRATKKVSNLKVGPTKLNELKIGPLKNKKDSKPRRSDKKKTSPHKPLPGKKSKKDKKKEPKKQRRTINKPKNKYSAKDKFKRFVKNNAPKVGKKLAKTAAKAALGAVAAIASNAAPQVNMLQAGILGYAAADTPIDKISDYYQNRKYNPKSSKYDATVEKEAQQLKAIKNRYNALNGNNQENNDGDYIDIDGENENTSQDDGQSKGEMRFDDFVQDAMAQSYEVIDKRYKKTKGILLKALIDQNQIESKDALRMAEKLEQELYKNPNMNLSGVSGVERQFYEAALQRTLKIKMDNFAARGVDQRKTRTKEDYLEALEETKENYNDVIKKYNKGL